jgi:alkylhydroperoxidase/carboxymuconolactone decarboxylase family protein YurZ
MDYMERLRRLAIHDGDIAEDHLGEVAGGSGQLDLKSVALVRLAALVAVGGTPASFGAYADAAIGAGATTDEIVDVLFVVLPATGSPRVVAAAPALALALGYDIDGDRGQGLVRAPAHLQPAPAVLQQDLAAERDRSREGLAHGL